MKKEDKNNFTDLDILRFLKLSDMVVMDDTAKKMLDEEIIKEESKQEKEEK